MGGGGGGGLVQDHNSTQMCFISLLPNLFVSFLFLRNIVTGHFHCKKFCYFSDSLLRLSHIYIYIYTHDTVYSMTVEKEFLNCYLFIDPFHNAAYLFV